MNVLDYTNVVIPVTKASSKIDAFDHDYEPLNEIDKNNWAACKSTTLCQNASSELLYCLIVFDLHKIDDPVAYDGAPAAVQILGRRLEEERILSIAAGIVEALRKYQGEARP